MNSHLAYALDHPVFDPERQIAGGHYRRVGRISLGLTVNIGMEWVRYAGGRPLWHISVALIGRGGGLPVPVLRWSPANWRKAEAARDQTMFGAGTVEEWFMEHMAAEIGERAIAVHWRKPLRIDEINRLAATAEVRARPGRA